MKVSGQYVLVSVVCYSVQRDASFSVRLWIIAYCHEVFLGSESYSFGVPMLC